MSDESSDAALAEEHPGIAVGLWIVIQALKDDKPGFAADVLYLMAEKLDSDSDG